MGSVVEDFAGIGDELGVSCRVVDVPMPSGRRTPEERVREIKSSQGEAGSCKNELNDMADGVSLWIRTGKGCCWSGVLPLTVSLGGVNPLENAVADHAAVGIAPLCSLTG
ncbi:hypothetical protein CTA1_10149 [Colletotrichum tanaceti]|uniref:Uncharacterized protein n=1 Tax=Colletotrichum tanaceti TaxID=1306861 RepID=A0A4U6X5I3_9PEZI|nr:hypothetical protein CTA1_10149 [Colletotrichum tanaceti]